MKIKELSQELDKMFEAKSRIGEIEKELLRLKPERYYFEDYYSSCNQMPTDTLKGLHSYQILTLLTEYEHSAEKDDKIGLLKKLTVLFEFGLNRTFLKVFSERPYTAIPYMKWKFYEVKQEKLLNEKLQLEKKLEAYSFEKVMRTLADKSLSFFYAQLHQKYGGKSERNVFESRDFIRIPNEFNREYPVILSTTYSIKSALGKNYIYDYIIVDEASQVDLATAVLAFSCVKNIVIVGDLQQLPNVITEKDVEICERI